MQRQNIAHYLDLPGRTKNEQEWATLLKLLREEEAKLDPAGGQIGRRGGPFLNPTRAVSQLDCGERR